MLISLLRAAVLAGVVVVVIIGIALAGSLRRVVVSRRVDRDHVAFGSVGLLCARATIVASLTTIAGRRLLVSCCFTHIGGMECKRYCQGSESRRPMDWIAMSRVPVARVVDRELVEQRR